MNDLICNILRYDPTPFSVVAGSVVFAMIGLSMLTRSRSCLLVALTASLYLIPEIFRQMR